MSSSILTWILHNTPVSASISHLECSADLERVCGPDCILSTNTSTIDIELIGAKTKSQDRIIGAHFFSPAHIMPLLEIVRTEKTSKQVIACFHHVLQQAQFKHTCLYQTLKGMVSRVIDVDCCCSNSHSSRCT